MLAEIMFSFLKYLDFRNFTFVSIYCIIYLQQIGTEFIQIKFLSNNLISKWPKVKNKT